MTLDALAAEIASQAKAEAKSIIDAANAAAKRIVRRRIRASVTRADAALTHTYASGLPRAAAP